MAKTKKPAPHPAIVALRNVHAQAFPNTQKGACYATDLVHDERAINLYPEDPFAWIITPHSTHFVRASADGIANSNLDRRREPINFLHAVADLHDPNLLFWIWDGRELRPHASIDDLIDAYIEQCRKLRIADLKIIRKTTADKIAKHGDCSDNYYSEAIARIDREIEQLESDF